MISEKTRLPFSWTAAARIAMISAIRVDGFPRQPQTYPRRPRHSRFWHTKHGSRCRKIRRLMTSSRHSSRSSFFVHVQRQIRRFLLLPASQSRRANLRPGPWYPAFLSELLFPAGKHDDHVDALGLVGQVLDRMAPGRAPEAPKPMLGIHGMMDDLWAAAQLQKGQRRLSGRRDGRRPQLLGALTPWRVFGTPRNNRKAFIRRNLQNVAKSLPKIGI